MDELNVFWTVIVFLIILLCTRYQPKRRKLPPGPRGVPVLGYYPFLGKDPVKGLSELGKKYGNVFGLHFGSKYLVVLDDWDALTDAYSQDVFVDRPPALFSAVPYNFGLGGDNGQKWVVIRRLVSRAMKDIGLNRTRWEELIQEDVSETVQRIVQHGQNPIEVRSFLQQTFTNNIVTLVLGERLHEEHPVTKKISRSVDLIIEYTPTMRLDNFSPMLRWIMQVFRAEKDRSDLAQEIEDFGKFVSNIVDDKVKNKEAEDSFIDLFYQELRTQHKGVLGENEIINDVKGNTLLLLTAGSETTRTTIIWLLLAMADHPDKQRKVHQELDMEIGTNGVVKWADRMKVPYTYATLLESSRWKSVVPISTLRIASRDTKIQGYDIPKGTFLTFNMWSVHNDPKFWEEPEKFRPERFLLGDGKKVNSAPKSYSPFSYGKRACPGKLIAMMEALQYFTTLMQKFTVVPSDGENVKYDTILGLTYQATNCNICFIPRQ